MEKYKANIFDLMNIMEETFKYIKSIKGNIPIDNNLFGKYKNVSEIFKEENKLELFKIILFDDIKVLKNVSVDRVANSDIYHIATYIFHNYHSVNTFKNNGNSIIVSNGDIKEIIHKINNHALQKKYLTEHLQLLSKLGKLIEKAKLVNQGLEYKNRESNMLWNYYAIDIIINDKLFIFEFDVISKKNGENHYHIQRLHKKQTLSSECVITNTNSNLTTSALTNNIS